MSWDWMVGQNTISVASNLLHFLKLTHFALENRPQKNPISSSNFQPSIFSGAFWVKTIENSRFGYLTSRFHICKPHCAVSAIGCSTSWKTKPRDRWPPWSDLWKSPEGKNWKVVPQQCHLGVVIFWRNFIVAIWRRFFRWVETTNQFSIPRWLEIVHHEAINEGVAESIFAHVMFKTHRARVWLW